MWTCEILWKVPICDDVKQYENTCEHVWNLVKMYQMCENVTFISDIYKINHQDLTASVKSVNKCTPFLSVISCNKRLYSIEVNADVWKAVTLCEKMWNCVNICV